MRFLLAGILILLPHITHAESPNCTQVEASSSNRAADPSDAEHDAASHRFIEFGLSLNPYRPASPTNFEVIIGPYLHVQGRQGIILYDTGSYGAHSSLDADDRNWTDPLTTGRHPSGVSPLPLGNPPGGRSTIR
jgi:hypothetical protein